MWFKYGYVHTYCSVNLFVFIHFMDTGCPPLQELVPNLYVPMSLLTRYYGNSSHYTVLVLLQKKIHTNFNFNNGIIKHVFTQNLQNWSVPGYEKSFQCPFMCHFPTIIVHFFPGLHPQRRGGLPSCRQSPPSKLKL